MDPNLALQSRSPLMKLHYRTIWMAAIWFRLGNLVIRKKYRFEGWLVRLICRNKVIVKGDEIAYDDILEFLENNRDLISKWWFARPIFSEGSISSVEVYFVRGSDAVAFKCSIVLDQASLDILF